MDAAASPFARAAVATGTARELPDARDFTGRDPREVLHEVYGYDAFRGDQSDIVQRVIDGGDAVVLMPTGGGKSVTYQVPALVRPGTGLVVSPLIALMHDQVDALVANGVRAAYLNSTQAPPSARPSSRPTSRATSTCSTGATTSAPTTWPWVTSPIVSRVSRAWRSPPRRRPRPPARSSSGSACATRARSWRASIARTSEYRIDAKVDPRRQLVSFIRSQPEGSAGIVYALSRKSVEQTASYLAAQGLDALPYHAGLDPAIRAANQSRFLRDDGVVMVATIAFGMGIDKPDVRFVAHIDLPKSVEGYYQETGRAGRDGDPSVVWMAYGLGDVVQQRRMIDQSPGDRSYKMRLGQHLDAMLALCETVGCRRQNLLAYFGEQSEPCGNCDTCLTPPDTWDGLVAAQKLLSTIVRLQRERGQAFGAGHLIDILRGAKTDRIAQQGHDRLSTYGLGADLSDQDWRSVIRQLLARGILVAQGDYGTLALSEASGGVLRGETPVPLRRDALGRTGGGGGSRQRKSSADDVAPGDRDLFEALRAWRAEQAREQGVPAYIVFGDATLRAIAAERPASRGDLDGITGIGAKKREAYGDGILTVVAQH
ncbi:hypothetical protein LUZ63_023088 [Rhynchospora breviuscula]|uniref:ATP-dependent DNA helicase n=1 Tax=Rhynchospora breviuscula TaxID=2022672 RepID=A0A9P9Z3I8_9POAL|nr:hypothetical protein LUZ63_023088 [Rhynchospora breviuscula]